MLPRMVRSPVDLCFGTKPSQAPKSRPFAKASPVPIAATIALEMIGPMPGTVIMFGDENDPPAKPVVSAFTQALAGLGWTDGRNLRIDLRWHGYDINQIPVLAQELVGLQPDIIVTAGALATAAVQRETRTIPIVFTSAVDPVASSIVAGLNQPGGNATGFANYEPTLGGKWLELLSEIAPGLKRAA